MQRTALKRLSRRLILGDCKVKLIEIAEDLKISKQLHGHDYLNLYLTIDQKQHIDNVRNTLYPLWVYTRRPFHSDALFQSDL